MSPKNAPTLIFAVIAAISALTFDSARAQEPGFSPVKDAGLGIAFNPMGKVQKTDSITYSMQRLSSASSPGVIAAAEVSVSDRLFVDLPGSYGGRFFLDTPLASRIFRSRIFVDTVLSGGYAFRREYWTVYAGMGMWEGVINCYARTGNRYCIVALVQEMRAGKPGEYVEGRALSAENLRTRVLSSLRDSTGGLVRRFDSLLSSVRISGQ